jgi:chemotaxis protein MotB
MADVPQIIIIKRKKGHAGHHGGAWKVAYADFVTAMMALFIVLWLMGSSKPVQESVGGYFRDPKGVAQKKGSGAGGAGDAGAPKKEDLTQLKEALLKSLHKMAGFDKIKDQVEIIVTPEGVRVELMENSAGTFFELGSARPKPTLESILKILSVEAGKLPNPVSIEGHTDSTLYSNDKTYGNWELSTDRANLARRMMEENGLGPTQVVQVRGYADRNLRKPQQPEDACNRRVTVLIQYMPQPKQSGAVFNGSLPTIAAPKPVEEAKAPEKAEGAKAPEKKE